MVWDICDIRTEGNGCARFVSKVSDVAWPVSDREVADVSNVSDVFDVSLCLQVANCEGLFLLL